MPARNIARGMKKAKPSAGTRNNEKRAPKSAVPDQTAKKAAGKPATAAAAPSLRERIAEAKKLEVLDRAKAPASRSKTTKPGVAKPQAAVESAAPSLRNSDFPNTYIKQISVQLDDPD